MGLINSLFVIKTDTIMAFNIEKFFFDTPIYSYEKIEEDDINSDDFDALFSHIAVIDIEGYNPWNHVDTTFTLTKSNIFR